MIYCVIMLVKPVKIKIPENYQTDRLAIAKKTKIESLYIGQLKQSGKVLLGICPFHEDKKPSFAIYPNTNSWYCFACGDGGDVIDFYMRRNSSDFKDALRELNDR